MATKWVRKIAVVAAGLLVSGGVWYLVNHVLQERYRKITIGRDTTYVSGPTFPDGRVDFLSAVNRQLSEGVTPGNNATVPLFQATSPKGNFTGWRLEFYQKALGIEAPAESRDTYVGFGDFMFERSLRSATQPQQVRNVEGDLRKGWDDRIDARAKFPWTRADDPEVFAWLEGNARVLDLVMEASRRERYFSPLISRPDLGCTAMAFVGPCGSYRDMAKLLSVRAMFSVGNHDIAAWRDDVLARQRLGRLMLHSGTVLEGIVALNVLSAADDSIGAALGALPPSDARQLLTALRDLPQPPDMIDCLDRYDRLGIIGELTKMAYFGPSVLDVSDDPAIPLPKPASLGFQAPIHFNDLLRQYNGLIDRYVAAGRLPTFSQRQAAFDAVDADCLAAQAKNTGRSTTAAIKSLFDLHIGHAKILSNDQDKMLEKSRLTQLALLLVAFRGEHGSYPATLAELADTGNAASDLFADDKPVHYVAAKGLIYSVGPNQRDDKGVYDRPKDTRSVSAMLTGAPAATVDFPDDIAIQLP
jgi:hypothetical protein